MLQSKIKKNIGIVVLYPPIQSDFKLYGVNRFEKNNFNVFFIDISKLYTPNLKYDPPVINNEMVKKIYTIEDLNDILEKDDLIVLSGVYFGFRSLWLYKLYKKFDVDYVVFDAFYHPLRTFKPNKKSFHEQMKRVTFGNIMDRLVKYNIYNQFFIKKADIALIPNYNSRILKSVIGKKTNVLFTHHPDYDKYLMTLDDTKSSEDIIVFLDEYLPYHPDFQVANSKSCVTPAKYYQSLSKFFDELEQKMNLCVVIAAHPRSAQKNLFGERKVFHNQTSELVKKSTLVVAHCSTSINFAALYKKPIVFITTDEISKSNYNSTIINMAKCFNKIPINIDNEHINIDVNDIYSMDLETYNNYINNHVKIPGTPELNSWEILINWLNENYNTKY